jgi:F0F1-type ATP synthase assembly protein I
MDSQRSPRASTQRPGSVPEPAYPAGPRAGATDWDDEDPPPRPLSAEEAAAFRGQRTAPSPWRVVGVQAQAGAAIALVVGLAFGMFAGVSALYGALTAVVPSALMARAVARMADSRSPMGTAAALLGWESVKIASSIVLLLVGLKALHLSPLPLLGGMAGCMAVVWVALLWRSR